MQLKTAVEPSTDLVPRSETSTVEPSALEESDNKLRAANDLFRKVKQDLERLKEVWCECFFEYIKKRIDCAHLVI